TIFSLSLIGANATEQDTVDRSAVTIREFRHMPEKGIPPRILRNARGLAIISVVKAGLIFSGKAGEGVVVARTGHGWSGPFFIGVSLEGAVIGTRKGANEHYYGRPVSAYDILHGRVAAPPGAANLRAALGR